MTEILDIKPEGELTQIAEGFKVQIKNRADLLNIPGVFCENPEAVERDQIFSKIFRKKRIYMSDQVEQARINILSGRDVLVLGMTGFSRLTDNQCLDWGIKPGAYENACMDILGTTINDLKREFPGIRPKIVHGASDLGVDKAAIEVANDLNLDHLGHSCPEYLFYVSDDKDPVYVAQDRKSYSDEFIKSLNILFSVGGRIQALEHDISAAIRFDKRLILLNVLQALSINGNPPARDGKGNVVDATTAFQNAFAMISGQPMFKPYVEIRAFASETTINYARNSLSPATSYGHWRRSI